MLSGALINLPSGFGEKEEIGHAKWEREEEETQLKSVIQLIDQPMLQGTSDIKSALAIHEYLAKEPGLTSDEEGKYSIDYESTKRIVWANIYILKDVVVVDSMANRVFVRNIINSGLGLPVNTISDMTLDTAKMAQDHAEQWVRSFSDRQGKVDRGVIYGDGVETDSVFGPELDRSKSESVGWTTDFFGSPIKVRVSPRGSVTVLSWPEPSRFLKFIEQEILPYNAIVEGF